MKVGDRVRVTAIWSSFRDYRGVVVALIPPLIVRLDGDAYPLRIEEESLALETDEPSMTGAE